MQFCMLVETRFLPVPKKIKVLNNFGLTSIFVMKEDDPTKVNTEEYAVAGDHMYLDGDEKDIAKWLKPHGRVWITKGSPQLEQFVAMSFTKP
jgi:hypothetical protein